MLNNFHLVPWAGRNFFSWIRSGTSIQICHGCKCATIWNYSQIIRNLFSLVMIIDCGLLPQTITLARLSKRRSLNQPSNKFLQILQWLMDPKTLSFSQTPRAHVPWMRSFDGGQRHDNLHHARMPGNTDCKDWHLGEQRQNAFLKILDRTTEKVNNIICGRANVRIKHQVITPDQLCWIPHLLW